ncbi:MAG: TrkA C-terminal domain-containing protein, partial [Planctomycetota bacterium]
GNAGILSASRYPLAMGRDRLLSPKFDKLGRFGTPTLGILVTAGLMIFFIVVLSAEGVAKIASAFNLFVFGLMNVSVIVMRESRIESYDPGFRSPLYPWTQILGVLIAVGLIYEMGPTAVFASFVLGVIGAGWYYYYARPKVVRDGAIYHVFSRLGNRRFDELDLEFRQIIKEKGLRDDDPFDDLVTRAHVINTEPGMSYDDIAEAAAKVLSREIDVLSFDDARQKIADPIHDPNTVVSHRAMLPHFRLDGLDQPHLLLVRCTEGLNIPLDQPQASEPPPDAEPPTERLQRREEEKRQRDEQVPDHVTVHAIFFLISPAEAPGLHLRVLAQIATRLESETFMQDWCAAANEQKLKETLLHHDRYLSLTLRRGGAGGDLIGQRLAELDLPESVLISLVHRDGRTFAPRGRTRLGENDRLTVIGEADDIDEVRQRWCDDPDTQQDPPGPGTDAP